MTASERRDGDGVDRSEWARQPFDRLGDGQAAKLGVLAAHDLNADRQTVSHPGWYHRGRGAHQVGREDRATAAKKLEESVLGKRKVVRMAPLKAC